jgi:hypothetical protein
VGIWLLLVALTCTSWELAGGQISLGSPEASYGSALMIIIAFFKVSLIGAVFMEIARAPVPLKVLFCGWVVIVSTTVIGIYIWGAR